MLLWKIDWIYLFGRFVRTSSDSNNASWDQAYRVFYENKSAFEHSMLRLQTLKIPIAKLQARHNCSEAKKKIFPKRNGFYSCLYLSNGAATVLTSNLCTPFGLHNGAIGKVIYFLHELRWTLISDFARGCCCAIKSHWARHACFSIRLSWKCCYSNYHCWLKKN